MSLTTKRKLALLKRRVRKLTRLTPEQISRIRREERLGQPVHSPTGNAGLVQKRRLRLAVLKVVCVQGGGPASS
jgi:hypothetical protein